MPFQSGFKPHPLPDAPRDSPNGVAGGRSQSVHSVTRVALEPWRSDCVLIVMVSTARSEIRFAAAFLLPLTLYVGTGATLVLGGYWLMQPTVIENSNQARDRLPSSIAYHRPASPPSLVQESEHLRSETPPVNPTQIHQEVTTATAIEPRQPVEGNRKKPKKVVKVQKPKREQWVERREEHPFWGPRASQTLHWSF